jgi:hypothetical protein
MAQKRLLDKKISVSEQVFKLSDKAKVLFSWGILHADDIGLLPRNRRTLKGLIMPIEDIGIDDFSKLIEEIINVGLWRIFVYEGEEYICIVNFSDHQTLRRDRQPVTILRSFEHKSDAKESWEVLFELLDIPMTDSVKPKSAEEKRREVKRREEKRDNSTKKTKVVNYTPEDMRLADLLAELIQTNNPQWQMTGNRDVWAEHIEKLRRIDKRSPEQIEFMIRWVQQDSFWHKNILSTAKLREKFNNLIPQVKKTKTGRAGTKVNW